MDGAHRAQVAEVAGGAVGRIELGDLPAQVAGLGHQSRDEAVNGCGVLHVAEQLAAAPAGDVAPVSGVGGRGAPPFPGPAYGGAVPAGQHGQPQVGEGHSPGRRGNPDDEAEAFEGRRELGGPLIGHAQQPGQVVEGQPGPVGEQVVSA